VDPVNSGALILRNDVALDAVIPGGGQERGRRGGTVDVAAAVGLACAARITMKELAEVNDRVLDLPGSLVARRCHYCRAVGHRCSRAARARDRARDV
jgi:cysteine desulfurase